MLFIQEGKYFIAKSRDITVSLVLTNMNKETYKDNYILGRITYNIEKLGCRYNPNVMKKFKH